LYFYTSRCISDVTATLVLGSLNVEGYILKRTFRVLLVYAAIVAVVAVFLE